MFCAVDSRHQRAGRTLQGHAHQHRPVVQQSRASGKNPEAAAHVRGIVQAHQSACLAPDTKVS